MLPDGTMPPSAPIVAVSTGQLVPPDSWRCGVGTYGTYDGCDCGYGLCDPDCNGQGGPEYAQSLYGCDQDGGPGTFANFRCISGVCTSLAALAGAATNCPCGVYGTDGACTCTPAVGGHSTGTTVFGAAGEGLREDVP